MQISVHHSTCPPKALSIVSMDLNLMCGLLDYSFTNCFMGTRLIQLVSLSKNLKDSYLFPSIRLRYDLPYLLISKKSCIDALKLMKAEGFLFRN